MQLQGKRVAILAENLYEDIRVVVPGVAASRGWSRVTIVGSGKDTYTSKHGYPVRADTGLRTYGWPILTP